MYINYRFKNDSIGYIIVVLSFPSGDSIGIDLFPMGLPVSSNRRVHRNRFVSNGKVHRTTFQPLQLLSTLIVGVPSDTNRFHRTCGVSVRKTLRKLSSTGQRGSKFVPMVHMKRLGVFLLPLHGILVHCKLPSSILSGCPQAICWFIHLGRKRLKCFA